MLKTGFGHKLGYFFAELVVVIWPDVGKIALRSICLLFVFSHCLSYWGKNNGSGTGQKPYSATKLVTTRQKTNKADIKLVYRHPRRFNRQVRRRLIREDLFYNFIVSETLQLPSFSPRSTYFFEIS